MFKILDSEGAARTSNTLIRSQKNTLGTKHRLILCHQQRRIKLELLHLPVYIYWSWRNSKTTSSWRNSKFDDTERNVSLKVGDLEQRRWDIEECGQMSHYKIDNLVLHVKKGDYTDVEKASEYLQFNRHTCLDDTNCSTVMSTPLSAWSEWDPCKFETAGISITELQNGFWRQKPFVFVKAVTLVASLQAKSRCMTNMYEYLVRRGSIAWLESAMRGALPLICLFCIFNSVLQGCLFTSQGPLSFMKQVSEALSEVSLCSESLPRLSKDNIASQRGSNKAASEEGQWWCQAQNPGRCLRHRAAMLPIRSKFPLSRGERSRR